MRSTDPPGRVIILISGPLFVVSSSSEYLGPLFVIFIPFSNVLRAGTSARA